MKKYLIIVMLMLLIGCSKQTSTENADYLRCHETSKNNMAETENGFYYAFDDVLFYADKDNMNNFVAVCIYRFSGRK